MEMDDDDTDDGDLVPEDYFSGKWWSLTFYPMHLTFHMPSPSTSLLFNEVKSNIETNFIRNNGNIKNRRKESE